MHDDEMRQQINQVFTQALGGAREDPWLAQRVLTAARETPRRNVKPAIVLVIVLCLALTATAGLAWAVSRQFFAQVAQMTVSSGDYADWSPEEKRYMVQLMGRYGLIPEQEARRLARRPEAEIDGWMLLRYGAASAPEDLGWISINRIAWVELGPYVHWDNETWIWYTEMMLEAGLWEQSANMDMHYTPGDEAVPPDTAIASARQHLLARDVPAERLDSARVIWRYMTDGADTELVNLSYWVTFVYPDQSEDVVRVLQDGTVDAPR